MLRSSTVGRPVPDSPKRTQAYPAKSSVAPMTARLDAPGIPEIQAAPIRTHTRSPDSSVSAAHANVSISAKSTRRPPLACVRLSASSANTAT